MGFYGHITNLQKTSMTFDKIYSNRFAMDSAVTTDGVYAGRYVLVEYSNPLDSTLLSGVMQFDGMLYAIPTQRDPEEWEGDKDIPENYLEKLQPLKVDQNASNDILDGYIKTNITVVCSANYNLGVVKNKDGDKRIAPISRKQYFKIANGDTTKMSYILFYNHKEKRFELTDEAEQEEKTGCSYLEIQYSSITTDSEAADANYLVNFNIDLDNYNTARGYDSTVWQKTYADGKAKYVMIAELNSVVPIIDVSADAPTLAPMMPHFDKDSTNIYYKLHMQPSWGFRIKGAKPDQMIPTLDYSGSVLTDAYGVQIKATKIKEEYPSDQKVKWINTALKDNDYTNQYLNEEGQWQDEETSIPGAIYFNKSGFSKTKSIHSKDWSGVGRTKPITDEITLTPSGYSGHLYPTHTTNGTNEQQPDVNELAIVLPSIGDTVAEMWDIIYGDVNINKGSERNTAIRWEDAKDLHAKEGLRLVRDSKVNHGYTYSPDEVNTLAGVINSVQDLMGMIISDDYPINDDNIDNLNENYIYYNSSNGKYYYKRRSYDYEPVEEGVDAELSPVKLSDWEEYKDKAWWVDTGSEQPDYMQEEIYRPDRKYVLGANVPNDKTLSYHFTTTEYTPGDFYLYTDTTLGNEKLPLVDAITQARYHKYYITNEPYNVNHIYYSIKSEPVHLNKDAKYYIPNKYYEGHFEHFNPPIKNKEEFETYIAQGIRIFETITTDSTYGLTNGKELKSGDVDDNTNFANLWYLTLETCAIPEKQFKEMKNPPMIFTVPNFDKSDNVPQNYYVMSEKYELFQEDGWEDIVSMSPGVYYYLSNPDKLPVSNFVDEKNVLKPAFIKDVAIDYDVNINENCLYFRRVVELILSSTDNVVDISKAVRISVQAFPDNLYRKYKDGDEEGYRSISASSDIIVNATNYGEISDLCSVTVRQLETGYISNKYYYQVTEGDKKNSIIIDNKLQPAIDRDYWLPVMINKKELTPKEVSAGRKPGVTYYQLRGGQYVEFTGDLASGNTYYVSSLTDAPEFYYPNKYYYKNEAGEYILDLSENITPGREYYKNPQFYVYNDPNGIYSIGAAWPLHQNPPEDSGIILARRIDSWELTELKEFDVAFNTLHGLILRINNMLMQGDTLTREDSNLQGIMNKFNDLVHRFGSMAPGQFMMVDNAGRMQGFTYSTKQKFSAENLGGQGVKIISTEGDGNGEDTWIDVDSNNDFRNPNLTFKHNFTKVEDTTSTSDNNKNASDTIQLYTPIVDAKGHVVGKNIETKTLPYGFKTIVATNTETEALTQETLSTNNNIVADNTQDTLSIVGGNKWIELTTIPASDNVIISHKARNVINDSTVTLTMDEAGEESDRNTFGPLLENIQYDPAGHIIARAYKSYKLPNSYQIFTTGADEVSTATNAHDTFTISGDKWIKPLVEQGKLSFTHINEYMTTGFVPAGEHALGAQTPQFGETFKLQTFTLDANGHLIGKSTENVTIPTNIKGLTLETYDATNSNYLTQSLTLEAALETLDKSIKGVQNGVDDLEESLTNHVETNTKEFQAVRDELKKESSALLESIEENYALKDGNVTADTLFTLQEEIPGTTDGDGNEVPATPAVKKNLAEITTLIGELDINAVRKDETFIYTPEVTEQTHEATQEDVDNGLAAAVGEIVVDVEHVPAEMLTIQELFTKVKELEILLNSLQP